MQILSGSLTIKNLRLPVRFHCSTEGFSTAGQCRRCHDGVSRPLRATLPLNVLRATLSIKVESRQSKNIFCCVVLAFTYAFRFFSPRQEFHSIFHHICRIQICLSTTTSDFHDEEQKMRNHFGIFFNSIRDLLAQNVFSSIISCLFCSQTVQF